VGERSGKGLVSKEKKGRKKEKKASKRDVPVSQSDAQEDGASIHKGMGERGTWQ
jgi:hypothetical protein